MRAPATQPRPMRAAALAGPRKARPGGGGGTGKELPASDTRARQAAARRSAQVTRRNIICCTYFSV